MKNLVLFDMDGTLTPPRSHLDYNLVDTLRELVKFAEIGIVTGSDMDYLMQQCGFLTSKDNISSRVQTQIIFAESFSEYEKTHRRCQL
jgi:hydroxymethylpyrimidine pyrophosphatase-like HAD family hydrolase